MRAYLLLAGATVVVYVALIAAAQILRRARGLRFGWIYHPFALANGLLAGVQLTGGGAIWGHDLLQHLTAVTLVLTAFPAITVLNHVLWARAAKDAQRSAAPRLLSDTTGMIVILAVGLAVLQFIYGVKVPGLVAGSGIIAIILGLALQDLLGNVLAGFALYLEKPFKTGDWLLVAGHHARVVEVNWRSTRLLTTDDVFLDVPNSSMVKEPIINFHQPDPIHAVRAKFETSDDVPPARAQAALLQAIAGVPGVCANPAPSVYVTEFAEDAVRFEIKAWISDHGNYEQILSDVHVACWYAARRAGMEFPYETLELRRENPAAKEAPAREAAARTLRTHAIFSFLSTAQIDELVQHSPVVLFAPGEHLITQGGAAGAMFLLARGRVQVRRTRDAQTNVVAELGAGDCVGEMSMLTEESRSASVVASEEVEAVEITPAIFGRLVRDNPDVVARLSELLAQRQLANEKLDAQTLPPARVEQARASMLHKLRRFFELDG